MKALVEYFGKRGILFRSLESVDLKTLGTRKKLSLYLGVDTEGYYLLIMTLRKKSRILRKEAASLMQLHSTLEQKIQARITKRYLLVEAPMCTKAKEMLENEGWEVVIGGKW